MEEYGSATCNLSHLALRPGLFNLSFGHVTSLIFQEFATIVYT